MVCAHPRLVLVSLLKFKKNKGNINSAKVLTFEYHVDISNIGVMLYW